MLANLSEPAYPAFRNNLAHEDVRVRYIVVRALENIGVVGDYIKKLVLDEDAVSGDLSKDC